MIRRLSFFTLSNHLRSCASFFWGLTDAFTPIIIRNIATPIVFIISLLVITLFILGESADALFLASTISLNSLIAIVQEIKAKQALHKLEILTAPHARRITSKGLQTISIDQINTGDHLEIEAGDQVPVDGIILRSYLCQLDESLLTGESQQITKAEEDTVMAGSLVVAGKAEIRVTASGKYTRVAQMTEKLRGYDQRLTPLQSTLNSVIRYLTYLAIVISLLIFIEGRQDQTQFITIINQIVAGAVSIVPEGLLLASTLLFSYGAIKMAREGVLVQRIAAIEGFGQLTTLCLDKTGTLTKRNLKLETILPFDDYSTSKLKCFLAATLLAEPSPSPTLQALRHHLSPLHATISQHIPFSSSRKWSAVRYQTSRRTHTIALGAPEVLARFTHLTAEHRRLIRSYTETGLRVLLMLDFKTNHLGKESLPQEKGVPAGIIVLSSNLRTNSRDTIFYLQAQGVNLKVISGDSPDTVQQISQQVGILNTDRILTGDQLALMDNETWEKEVPQNTLFARVLPEQKERLLAIFQKTGFTGMVGDGVNDALALKRADLSVAMFEGSSAARQVADVILLKNDFAAFPVGMRLGSQIIIGLEMVASIFFNKITYGLTIILLGLMLNMHYPFLPRHVILLNLFIVGLPSILWSLAPPQSSFRLNPRYFFKRVLSFSIPNGIITGIAVLSAYATSSLVTTGTLDSPSTASVYTATTCVTFVLGMLTFWLIPRTMRAVDNHSQRTIKLLYFLICMISIIFLSQQVWFLEFFSFASLNLAEWLAVFCITLAASLLQIIFIKRTSLILDPDRLVQQKASPLHA